MRSNDSSFPTLPEAGVSSVSSNVRKAHVRAALFRKLEPVRVGRFILLEQLGAGAMGEIYAAYDEQLDRRVALKLVRHGSDLTVKADELLLREAQSLAQVSHPNVVQIYEAGTHEGRLFIAMELIRGQTLTRWLRDAGQVPRPQRRREILRQFIAAGRGLEAAHEAGVAHRDFKPDNVLVGDDGRVRVVDFGLARALDEVMAPGASGRLLGSGGRGAGTEDFAHGQTVRMDQGGEARVPAGAGVVGAAAVEAGSKGSVGSGSKGSAGSGSKGSEASGSKGSAGSGSKGSAGSGSKGSEGSGFKGSVESASSRSGARASDRPASAVGDDAAEAPASSLPKLRAATRLTETGMVMGTPRFMAPEQIRGAIADHRSDQFSFCVALHHALYGEFPFAGERIQELLDAMETGATSLEHSAGLGARVRRALRRGLSVDPSQRFASMGELLAEIEPSIRRKGGWIAGAVLLAVAAFALLLFTARSADPCANVGDGIDQAWSTERQVAVYAAFLRSGLPYAETGWNGAKQRLDGHAKRWRDEARGACRAMHVEHVQSPHQFDRRMLCLDRDRRLVTALVGELAAGSTDAVQRAVALAESLPDARLCSRTENILFGVEPPYPAIAADVGTVRDQLARARMLELMGRGEESLALARTALTASERIKYSPLHAEAQFQVARALDVRGVATARVEAEDLYFQALDTAEAERHDQLAVEIWNRLVVLAVRFESGTEQAHARWRRNAAAVRRVGSSAYELATLNHLRADIYFRDGKYADAADAENAAIASLDAPLHNLELARYYDGLGKALMLVGRADEAAPLYQRALQLTTEALSASHPEVARLQHNHGMVLQKRGDLEGARRIFETALANMSSRDRGLHLEAGKLLGSLSELSYTERNLDEAAERANESLEVFQRGGAPARLIVEAQTNLGNVEMQRQNYAAALVIYRDTLALRRQFLDRNHRQIGINEGSVADALVGLGRYDDAAPHMREAERILASSPQGTRAWSRALYGEVLVGQRQLDAALHVLEQSLAWFDDNASPVNKARAMWALARALDGLGKDPARARGLAEQARDLFAKVAGQSANRAAVEEFIDRRLPVVKSAPASPSPRPGSGRTR
jgi:eukaryotic-like serine/threonine-protein kinase